MNTGCLYPQLGEDMFVFILLKAFDIVVPYKLNFNVAFNSEIHMSNMNANAYDRYCVGTTINLDTRMQAGT